MHVNELPFISILWIVLQKVSRYPPFLFFVLPFLVYSYSLVYSMSFLFYLFSSLYLIHLFLFCFFYLSTWITSTLMGFFFPCYSSWMETFRASSYYSSVYLDNFLSYQAFYSLLFIMNGGFWGFFLLFKLVLLH